MELLELVFVCCIWAMSGCDINCYDQFINITCWQNNLTIIYFVGGFDYRFVTGECWDPRGLSFQLCRAFSSWYSSSSISSTRYTEIISHRKNSLKLSMYMEILFTKNLFAPHLLRNSFGGYLRRNFQEKQLPGFPRKQRQCRASVLSKTPQTKNWASQTWLFKLHRQIMKI